MLLQNCCQLDHVTARSSLTAELSISCFSHFVIESLSPVSSHLTTINTDVQR